MAYGWILHRRSLLVSHALPRNPTSARFNSFQVELIGYAARAASATQKEDQWSIEPYLIQSTFLLVAPSFFAASIYSVLGRIIASTDGDAYALIKKRWAAVFFVMADVFAFLMQAVGERLKKPDVAHLARLAHASMQEAA